MTFGWRRFTGLSLIWNSYLPSRWFLPNWIKFVAGIISEMNFINKFLMKLLAADQIHYRPVG
jgi:hypothetical protein